MLQSVPLANDMAGIRQRSELHGFGGCLRWRKLAIGIPASAKLAGVEGENGEWRGVGDDGGKLESGNISLYWPGGGKVGAFTDTGAADWWKRRMCVHLANVKSGALD